jgi:uncharacterized protein
MIFDWDENKEKLNIRNHDGIDFNEASEIFFDANIWETLDTEHSTLEEKRFTGIGFSGKKFLRVSYTVRFDRNGNEIIRIISARKAKQTEEDLYYGKK